MEKRIVSLDVIRGISLLGILFMNALWVHYFTVFDTPFEYYEDETSHWLYKFNLLFIQNSFYPIFAFLFGNFSTMNVLKPMHAVGKLGFTVYIMQSILLFLIFYVFKLYGTLSISLVYIIIISIAYFQIIFCNIYLKHYKMGPLEWLWRKITYLK